MSFSLKIGQIILYRSLLETNFKFWVISLLQHRCSSRAWWTTISITFKWQQFKTKTRNLTWVYGVAGCRRQAKMISIDLGRTINAPTWADFNLVFQKELTTKVYHTKRSSTKWFMWSILRDKEMLAHTYARVRNRWENEVTRAPNIRANHSPEQTNRVSTGMETTPQISRNQTKSSDFCMNEEK